MILIRSALALLLSLTLMLGSVAEALARNEMAGASVLVLCTTTGPTTVTLDASGQPMAPGHPCTHCLAAAALAVLPAPVQPPHPVPRLHPADLALTTQSTPASPTTDQGRARAPPALV